MKRISIYIYIYIIGFSISCLNLNLLSINVNSPKVNSQNLTNKKLKPSNPTLWTHNYDDENQEVNAYVYYDSSSDFQYLIVEFPIPSGTYCIVKGCRFKYMTTATGPYNLEISYFSDDFDNESSQWWVDTTINNLPDASSPSWHTNYYHGPVYAIDDTPAVMFSCDHPYSDCIRISADTPSYGHSYFYDENGIFIDSTYEWIVDLMYEEITNLTDVTSTTGDISGNDYLDAYFMYMEEGNTYNISLNRDSGTGNLNMRLVEFEPLTLTNIKNNTEFSYPKNISYSPSISGTYILLVEPNQYNIDFAQYTIMVEDVNGGSDDNGSTGGNGRMTPAITVYIIIATLMISALVIGSLLLIKRKYFGKPKIIPESAPTPVIVGSPKSIFMSYSTLDSEYFQISKIVERLKSYPEIEEVLFWEADSSANIVEYMEETLKKCNIFILFCSEKSLQSKAVRDEWQVAFQLRKRDVMKIIPVYENEEHIPRLLLHLLNVNFTPNDFNGFIERLYKEILRI